jgi:predicted short-subunit dehydrogenase-like oxidoreductase (DUF2520 family)
MQSPSRQDAPSVAVLGLGRAGRDLVHMARASGIDVTVAWSRTLCGDILPDVTVEHGDLPSIDAALVVLAVPDSAIGPVAAELRRAGVLQPTTTLAHLSGATAATALRATGDGRGCVAMHPLQTFLGDGRVPRPFPWILEGDTSAVEIARRLVSALGCSCIELPEAGKARYHAAATMASNLLVGLLRVVERQAALAGLPASQLPQLFVPLMQATLSNAAAVGTSRALTGPIRRGDLDTVAAHLRTLEDSPEDLDVYARLSLHLIDAALESGLDEETAEQLRRRLTATRCPRGEGG